MAGPIPHEPREVVEVTPLPWSDTGLRGLEHCHPAARRHGQRGDHHGLAHPGAGTRGDEYPAHSQITLRHAHLLLRK